MYDRFGDYPAETLSPTVEQRAIMWAAFGEQGISSRTIFAIMTGAIKHEDAFPRDWARFNVPHDPSDFRRCYLLLKLIPEWRERLEEMADAFPKWRPFVDRWDEMTALYEQERENPKGLCPKLYEQMTQCEKMRSWKDIIS